MTQQRVVLGAFGHNGVFVPQLFLLFGTALFTTFALYRVSDAREAPCFAGKFPGKPSTLVNAEFLGGAALFGSGWGLSGLCPGPWIVNLVGPPAADPSLLIFGAGLAAGILAHKAFKLAGEPAAKMKQ